MVQTKLESLRNAQEKATLELRDLNDRRSAFQRDIANLTAERDELHQKLDATIAQAESLSAAYKEAEGQAAQTEHFRRSAEEIQRQLQETIAEANAAKAAAEAAKWHKDDGIAITVLDAKSNKPLAKCNVRKVSDIPVRWTLEGQPTTRLTQFFRTVFVAESRVTDDSGRLTYKVTDDDVTKPDVQLSIAKTGYGPTMVSVPWGTKSFTVFLTPGSEVPPVTPKKTEGPPLG